MKRLLLICFSALLIAEGTRAGWQSWQMRDYPSGNGDYETKADMTGDACLGGATPTKLEVRLHGTTAVIISTDQLLIVGPDYGLVCKNVNQTGNCRQYSVRYEDPQNSIWFNRDGPGGTGDWELKSLETGSEWKAGKFVAWAAGSDYNGRVDRKILVGPNYGLSCVNANQPSGTSCRNYDVRYYC